MHLPKLVKTLQAFDPTAFLRLKEFVNAPYFKVPKASVVLFNYLYTCYPKFTVRKVNLEDIAQLGENLSTYAKQSAAASKLLDGIDLFLACEQWQRNNKAVQRYTLAGFKDMQWVDEFDKAYENELAELDQTPEQDIDSFYHRHILTELAANGFSAKLVRTHKNNLVPVIQTLDEFHALKKLRYLCEVFSRQWMGGNYPKQDVLPLLDILKPYNRPEHPYVYLFIHVYLMLSADTYEESTGPYNVIKQFAEQHSEGVLPKSVLESMGYAINYALRWFNKGFETAADEYLWWTDLKMKKNVLLEGGKILPISFRNIISLSAISNNNPDWMQRFIERYAPHLPEAHRLTNHAFALGLYAYKCGRYKEAIRQLMIAHAGEETNFNCVIRRWQFMALYNFDSSETETLLNHLDAFEKYMLRHAKQVATVKRLFDKFIHYAQLLIRTSPYDIGETLLLTLQAEEYFPGKQWLAEQMYAKSTNVRRQTSKVRV
ncbi:MAG: hypothetical protein KIS94_12310 [Chitinophagales bacterium]|nr:hypothetical protein [Chitinophagales bacterium]